MRQIFNKLFGYEYTRFSLNNGQKIIQLKLPFVGAALMILAIAYALSYQVANHVDKNELVDEIAEELFERKNQRVFNTVLKTPYNIHLEALGILQTSPFIDSQQGTAKAVQRFFSKAQNNELIGKEEYKNLIKTIQMDKGFAKNASLEEYNQAKLLTAYLQGEYFKSKAIDVETQFLTAIEKYIDADGTPILNEYTGQREYDYVTNKWLSEVTASIVEYDEQMDNISATIEVFAASAIEFPNNDKKALEDYRSKMFAQLIKLEPK